MTTLAQEKADWSGQSGAVYRYSVYPIRAPFRPLAGNYIFCRRNGLGHWLAVYVGQTSNLAERFDDHHKMPCISRYGATHIHAHANAWEADRLSEEADLIRALNPPCNG